MVQNSNKKIGVVNFVYSPIYDELLTQYEGKNFSPRQIEEIRRFTRKIKVKWQKYEGKVFRLLEKITHSKWKTKQHDCYIVKYCKYSGISHPLTLRVIDDDILLGGLIHELVHRKLEETKNYPRVFEYVSKRFPKESPRTQRHIIVNLICLMIYEKLLTETQRRKILAWQHKLIGLKRAWEIIAEILDKLEGENLYDALIKFARFNKSR